MHSEALVGWTYIQELYFEICQAKCLKSYSTFTPRAQSVGQGAHVVGMDSLPRISHFCPIPCRILRMYGFDFVTKLRKLHLLL
jgi:hypothetical protein